MTIPLLLRPLVTAGLLLAGAALACAAKRPGEPFSLVGMDEVQAMLSQPDVAVIDANTHDMYVKNHLPGARFFQAGALAKVLPAYKTTRLVFYCASPS